MELCLYLIDLHNREIIGSVAGEKKDRLVESSFAVNKIIKTEFIYQNRFETLEELQLELAEYVYWYNNLRSMVL